MMEDWDDSKLSSKLALLRENPSSLHPSEARELFRRNLHSGTTAGFCAGYIQTNLAVLPEHLSDDFEEFCRRNRAPFPLIYRSKPGEVAAPPVAKNSDVRTDMARFLTYTNGELSGEPTDLTDIPWENMTSFYYGCSFTFEAALIQAGIRVRHLDEGKDVPIYRTDIQLHRSGVFQCRMIVSMRPFPRALLSRVAAITTQIPEAHGAPIHIGDPNRIGIANIGRPLYSESVEIKENEVPVFWGCGVSVNEAIPIVRPELAFTHTWAGLFLSDIKYQLKQLKNIPEVVAISNDIDGEPFFASIVSLRSLEKVSKLEQMVLSSHETVHSNTNATLLKAVLVVSHASKVAILLRDFVRGEESCSLLGVFAICQALLTLEKQVVLISSDDNRQSLETSVTKMVRMGILTSKIPICPLSKVESAGSTLESDCLVTFSAVRDSNTSAHTNPSESSKLFVSECRNAFKLDKACLPIATRFSNWGGYALSLGLYLVSSCPLHWRYKNRGIGAESPPDLSVSQFLPSPENTVLALKLVNDLEVDRDYTGDRSSLTFGSGIPLEEHLKKLEELTALALSEVLHV